MSATVFSERLLLAADQRPEEPAFFERRGGDWHWLSFAAAAAALEVERQRCAAFAPSSTVDYAARPTAACVLTGLALGERVALSRPIGEGGAVAPRRNGSLEPVAFDSVTGDSAAGESTARVAGESTGEPAGERSISLYCSPGASPGAAPRKLEIPWGRLEGVARSLGERLPPSGVRDVVVLGRPVDRLDEQLVLGWAIVSGAAIVFESEPLRLPATLLWARPTVVSGTLGELEELGDVWAAGRGERGLLRRAVRRGLARVRGLLVDGDPGRLSQPWSRLDATATRLPGAESLQLDALPGDEPRPRLA